MSNEDFVKKISSYEQKDGVDIFTSIGAFFDKGDNSDNQSLDYVTSLLELSEKSGKQTTTTKSLHEGIPDIVTPDTNDTPNVEVDVYEFSFDKEQVINFDTVGYDLVA